MRGKSFKCQPKICFKMKFLCFRFVNFYTQIKKIDSVLGDFCEGGEVDENNKWVFLIPRFSSPHKKKKFSTKPNELWKVVLKTLEIYKFAKNCFNIRLRVFCKSKLRENFYIYHLLCNEDSSNVTTFVIIHSCMHVIRLRIL